MDRIDQKKRSALMARVKSRDTRPEWIVRRMVWALGRRYRLHVAALPGKPDLVFAKTRQVIFVNGCYWHRHDCRKGRSTPTTRAAFWLAKFERNFRRDREVRERLRSENWSVLDVWECQTEDRETLRSILSRFLEAPRRP